MTKIIQLADKCVTYIFRKCITRKDGTVVCAKKGKALKIPIEVPCDCEQNK